MNRLKTFFYWIMTAAVVNIIGYLLVWLNNDSAFVINILQGVIHGMSVLAASSVALNTTENQKGTRRYLNGVNLIASLSWVILAIAQVVAIIILLRNNYTFSELIVDNPEAFAEISGGIAVSYATYRIYKKGEFIF